MSDAFPTATVLGRLSTRRLGRPLLVLEATASTNRVATRLARSGQAEGLVVVARRQTDGRGRHGRTWASPPGGLYLSAVLRPRLHAVDAARLGFAAAVAAATTLRDHTGVTALLDWPNDVVTVSGKKLGGVLAESRASAGGRLEWAVLGVGLNLSTDPAALPPEIRARASSVRAEGGSGDLPLVLPALLEALEGNVDGLEREGGWEGLLSRFRELAIGLEGSAARFRREDGHDIVGTTAGVDARGGLRLRTADGGTETLVSGERVRGLDG